MSVMSDSISEAEACAPPPRRRAWRSRQPLVPVRRVRREIPGRLCLGAVELVVVGDGDRRIGTWSRVIRRGRFDLSQCRLNLPLNGLRARKRLVQHVLLGLRVDPHNRRS